VVWTQAIVAPPRQLDAEDLKDAVDHAAATVRFTTNPHPANPGGWPIQWGERVLTKVITVAVEGQVTDVQVAAYPAKYATKSTEVTGHASNRLTEDTIDLYADPDGTHTERLIDACSRLGNFRTNPAPPERLGVRRPGPEAAFRFESPMVCRTCGSTTRYRGCPTRAAGQVADADADRHTPAGQPASPYFRLRRWAHMLGLRRPLPHQEPPLLHHLRDAP
jgi:hypothetical protein